MEKPKSTLFVFLDFIYSFFDVQGVNIAYWEKYLQENLTPTTYPEKTVIDT